MKTKNPKCFRCNKVMKVIYTKRSYELNGKYKTYWNKEGYICNHLYYPITILIPHKKFKNYLIDVYDTDMRKLLKSLRKMFN